MKTIYTKQCECGNVITVTAERVSQMETKYHFKGVANKDFLDRVACTCWKTYSVRRAMDRFHTQNRKTA